MSTAHTLAIPNASELKRFRQAVRRSKLLDHEFCIEDWLVRIRFISAQTQSIGMLRKVAIASMVLSAIGCFASLASEHEIFALPMLGWFGVGLMIVIKTRDNTAFDRLHNSILPLLTILQQDADADALVKMRIDLSGPEMKNKTLKTGKSPGKHYPKVEETLFRDPWLEGKLTLVDGSTLTWSVIDMVRRRIIRKRNPRGKIKTKTKFKIKTRLLTTLSCRKDRYHYSLPAATTQLRSKETDSRILLKSRRVVQGYQPLERLALQELLAGISDIYRCLTPGK